MSRNTGKQDDSRRRFLRSLAVMGGVTVVAATAGPATAQAPARTGPASSSPQGYRVTPHVAKYYDKARF